jgi:hypothetical protein
MKTVLTTLGISLLVLAGCAGQKQAESNFIQENIDNAVAQETIQTDIIEKSGKILNPRTIDKDGNIVYVPIDDWCSGFFPGNIWHMYELTGDQKWLPLAEKYTEDLDSVQYLTWHHDVGFMIGSSYLNGYRFAGKEEYKPVIIQTAKSLSTRFRPAAGVLQSWDADKGWQAERGWKCPVIIDNMMNLELLFEASRLSGERAPTFHHAQHLLTRRRTALIDCTSLNQQPAGAVTFEIVIAVVTFGRYEEFHTSIFPYPAIVSGSHCTHTGFLHFVVEQDFAPRMGYAETHFRLIGVIFPVDHIKGLKLYPVLVQQGRHSLTFR